MKKKSRQIDIEKMKRLICRRIKFFLLLAIVLSFLIVVVLGVSGNLSTNTNVSSAAASENATARARLTESQAEAVEESYKSYLEQQGATIKKARLIKLEELLELGCNMEVHTCQNAPSFIGKISFWTGTARSENLLWAVSNSVFGAIDSISDMTMGLRPVIII